MTLSSILSILTPHIHSFQALQTALDNTPLIPKTNHEKIHRESLLASFTNGVDRFVEDANSLLPDHWDPITLEIYKKGFDKNLLQLDTPCLDRNSHTDFTPIVSMLAQALTLAPLPKPFRQDWNALGLPETFSTPYTLSIDAFESAQYDGLSLGDCIGQAITKLAFWEEDYFLTQTDKTTPVDTQIKATLKILETDLRRHTDCWDATPLFIQLLWTYTSLTDEDIIDLQNSLRLRGTPWNSKKAHHFLSQLYTVAVNIPKGGKPGSYMVSSHFEIGDEGSETIVHAKNSRHAMAMYFITEALTLMDDIDHFPLDSFEVFKIQKSTTPTIEPHPLTYL